MSIHGRCLVHSKWIINIFKRMKQYNQVFKLVLEVDFKLAFHGPYDVIMLRLIEIVWNIHHIILLGDIRTVFNDINSMIWSFTYGTKITQWKWCFRKRLSILAIFILSSTGWEVATSISIFLSHPYSFKTHVWLNKL